MAITAGEPRWSVADSIAMDEAIVGERLRLVGPRTRRAARRCRMQVRPDKYRRFRCRGRAVCGSKYCIKHLGGK